MLNLLTLKMLLFIHCLREMVDLPGCYYRPGFIIKLLETYQQRFTISTVPSYYPIKHCYGEIVLMKILIAEFASHWKVLENTYRLLEKTLRKSRLRYL